MDWVRPVMHASLCSNITGMGGACTTQAAIDAAQMCLPTAGVFHVVARLPPQHSRSGWSLKQRLQGLDEFVWRIGTQYPLLCRGANGTRAAADGDHRWLHGHGFQRSEERRVGKECR